MKRINFENVIAPREFVSKITACSYLFGYEDTANAVGFVGDIPVVFDYEPNDNYMNITCKDMKDTDKLSPIILEYLTSVETNSKIMARFYTNVHGFKLMFWWKEDEEN